MYNNTLNLYDAFYRSNMVIKTFMIYYAVFLLSLYILCSRKHENILLYSLANHRKKQWHWMLIKQMSMIWQYRKITWNLACLWLLWQIYGNKDNKWVSISERILLQENIYSIIKRYITNFRIIFYNHWVDGTKTMKLI